MPDRAGSETQDPGMPARLPTNSAAQFSRPNALMFQSSTPDHKLSKCVRVAIFLESVARVTVRHLTSSLP